jgi:hypothetical protein
MSFLEQSLTTLRGFLRRRRDPGPISQDETLARFLVRRKQFSEPGPVKPQAFMPPRDRLLSTFRTKELGEDDIWALGYKFVATPQAVPLYGRGELGVRDAVELGLRVERDVPPPRHANIAGWPEDKAQQKSLAQQLAAVAILRLDPHRPH